MARKRSLFLDRVQSVLSQGLAQMTRKPSWRLRRRATVLLVIALLTTVVCVVAPTIATHPAVGMTEQSASNNPEALDQEGQRLYEAQRYSEAIAPLQQAIQGYAQQGKSVQQVMALRNLALVYQALGNWSAVDQTLTTGFNQLDVISEPDRSIVEARLLDLQGLAQLHQGQLEEALATWETATAIYQRSNDQEGLLRSQVNQAQALQSLGFYRRAIATLTPLTEQLQQQPDSATKAIAFRSLGDALQYVGAFDAARTALNESLVVGQRLQILEQVGATYLSLANTARAQGDFQVALDFYQSAESQSPSLLVQTQARLNRLSLSIEVEQYELAQSLVPQIAANLDQLPPSQALVYAKVNFAQSLVQLSDRTPTPRALQPSVLQAAQILSEARQQAQTLQNPRAESFVVGSLGSLYEKTQQWSESKQLTESALVLAQDARALDIAYRWQWQLGRLLKAEGKIEEAIAAYSAAVDSLQTLRTDLVAISPEVQLSFQEGVEPVHRELVSLLLTPNQGEPSQAKLEKARKVIESLQLAELDNFFREACLDATPVDIDNIDQQAAVIYPILLPDRLEVILRLPQQDLQRYSSSVPKATIERTIAQLRRSLTNRTSRTFLPLAQRMYDWIMRPAESTLADADVKTLVFVLDGSLRNVPMAVLNDGQKFLLEKYDLALTPGLQLLDPRPLERGEVSVLGAGLTAARQGFPALPNVVPELERIGQEVPTRTLVNESFTSPELKDAITSNPSTIVHMATHGKFGSTFDQTFILTWDGRIDINQLNGLLQNADLTQTNPIQLLVLSACQTAVGDNLAALGLAGMAVRAGARSTLATLWQVNDAATAMLMDKFYDGLINGGLTKAGALRQAQLEILAVPEFRRHPYYWAPYIIVGNWL
ncbi:CHAT domain-containing protein [Oscillatoria sp. FACHB-1407]|uniref:CHAT domain-containing protein n=1 Tax=Oscillatoria sp. FACHB-1407 TaxID=2692847 RepID=UPI0016839B78|nr:CHAT domain-containing protein [Oscillatoria sp. FACHB-1407]MBD2461534.1 CHAT domain-containing protein [Oscillatoria sp. FACHB-1407]